MALELPLCTQRPSSPSLRELSEDVQKKIDLHRSSKYDSVRPRTMVVVPEPAIFTSRTLKDPIAAIEICPTYPDYAVIGTYALRKPDDLRDSAGQVRNGSVIVVPLAASFRPAYPGAAPPYLDEKCLGAAVLDIHFHPSDDTLLGVATSDASMAFFRLTKRADVLARRIEMKLDYLGRINVAEQNEHGETPLITSFCWLPGLTTQGSMEDEYYALSFAATVSNGDVKVVRAITPANAVDSRLSHQDRYATVANSNTLEKHTEEAWTVAAAIMPAPKNSLGDNIQILILSGGDDSALIATSVDLNSTLKIAQCESPQTATLPPTLQTQSATQPSDDALSPSLLTSTPLHLWTDRKSHTAGVVAILPLSLQPASSSIPILTGSYDEHIRLFLLDTASPILKRNLVLEQKLGGGVWRLKLMHESTTTSTAISNTTYTALILASCMHGGVRILRLTHTPPASSRSPPAPPPNPAQGWQLTALQKFTKGHESMNYGSDFHVERDEDGIRTGAYTIVSTSFYDKAVCVWTFVDEDEARAREGKEKRM